MDDVQKDNGQNYSQNSDQHQSQEYENNKIGHTNCAESNVVNSGDEANQFFYN